MKLPEIQTGQVQALRTLSPQQAAAPAVAWGQAAAAGLEAAQGIAQQIDAHRTDRELVEANEAIGAGMAALYELRERDHYSADDLRQMGLDDLVQERNVLNPITGEVYTEDQARPWDEVWPEYERQRHEQMIEHAAQHISAPRAREAFINSQNKQAQEQYTRNQQAAGKYARAAEIEREKARLQNLREAGNWAGADELVKSSKLGWMAPEEKHQALRANAQGKEDARIRDLARNGNLEDIQAEIAELKTKEHAGVWSEEERDGYRGLLEGEAKARLASMPGSKEYADRVKSEAHAAYADLMAQGNLTIDNLLAVRIDGKPLFQALRDIDEGETARQLLDWANKGPPEKLTPAAAREYLSYSNMTPQELAQVTDEDLLELQLQVPEARFLEISKLVRNANENPQDAATSETQIKTTLDRMGYIRDEDIDRGSEDDLALQAIRTSVMTILRDEFAAEAAKTGQYPSYQRREEIIDEVMVREAIATSSEGVFRKRAVYENVDFRGIGTDLTRPENMVPFSRRMRSMNIPVTDSNMYRLARAVEEVKKAGGDPLNDDELEKKYKEMERRHYRRGTTDAED